MTSTTFTNFSAIDFRGIDSLSSYAIPITPFIFIPDIPKVSDNRVVWDFGDGTISKTFSASKSYTFPGIYTVKLVIYDCNSNAMISTVSKTVTIYDYIPLTITANINYESNLITEGGLNIITEDDDPIIIDSLEANFPCGSICGPIEVKSYYPAYQPVLNIFYNVLNSNSYNYWSINNLKFAHLDYFNTFYESIYNYTLGSYQYNPIDRIIPISTPLYAKLVNGSIVSCPVGDLGSTYVGASAEKIIYFKDDSVSGYPLIISLHFDKTNIVFNQPDLTSSNYLNNLGIALSANIVPNNNIDRLSITSNGIDGEGYHINSFDINSVKFFDTKIPFVVKIKDIDNMSVKSFLPIDLSDLHITTNPPNIPYSIVSLNNTLSGQSSGGAFRGYITFPYTGIDEVVINSISVNMVALGNYNSASYILQGTIPSIVLRKSDYYNIYKKNENFNPQQTLMDLRFQETLLDKNILFEDFLGSLLGNDTSNHEAIGIKLYEKLMNIVPNTQDIDVCECDFLDSIAHFVNYNNVREEKYQFPEKIKRLINLASIDDNKLIGETNKFKENLDIRGYTSKDIYGTNIGSQINTSTYTVSAEAPIVALELFSNKYYLLNTQQPLSTVGSTRYALSSYSSDWGWPLVLPSQFSFNDIGKYYKFFRYQFEFDNSLIGGVIDFDNPRTAIESNLGLRNTSIAQYMFAGTLYQSLSLVNQ